MDKYTQAIHKLIDAEMTRDLVTLTSEEAIAILSYISCMNNLLHEEGIIDLSDEVMPDGITDLSLDS